MHDKLTTKQQNLHPLKICMYTLSIKIIHTNSWPYNIVCDLKHEIFILNHVKLVTMVMVKVKCDLCGIM